MKSIISFVVAMDDGDADKAIEIIQQGDCCIEIQIWIEVYDEDKPQHPLWAQVRPAAIQRVEELRPTQPSLSYSPGAPSKVVVPEFTGITPRPLPHFSITIPPIKKRPLHERFFGWVEDNYALYMLLCVGIGSILRWYCTGQDINRFISPEPFWPF